MHTRNRHLRNQRGFSVAFSNGIPAAFSNIISFVRGTFHRIVTSPVDAHWNCLIDVQLHFPMDFRFCDFWCFILT